MDWQRPHPLTLVTLVVQALSQTILPLLLVLGRSDDDGSFFGQYAELLFFFVPLGLALARWYSTRYALDEEAIYLNQGIFIRTKQVLPRSKVQNLSTTAPLLARATGLVELNISDASADGDIKLRLIERSEAERLSALLRRDISRQDRSLHDPALYDPALQDPALYDATRPDLAPQDPHQQGPTKPPAMTADNDGSLRLAPPVVQSVGHQHDSPPKVNPSTSKLFKISAALTASAALPNVVVGLWLAWLNWANGNVISDAISLELPVWAWLAVVPAVGLFFSVVSAGARVLTLGGFRLWDDPDRLRIKAGLLTERQITARRERIQLVRVNRPWLARILGLEEIRFSTADVEDLQTAHMTILNPAADLGDWEHLAPSAIGAVELTENDLQQVSPLAQRRVFIRFLVLAILVGALATVGGLIWSNLILIAGLAGAVAIGVFGWFFAKRRFERLGYAMGPSQVLTRVGVLNEQLTLLRKEKVQGVVVASTYFQRRLNLATLSVGTAGHGGSLGGLRLPDLPAAVANELATILLIDSANTPLDRTL